MMETGRSRREAWKFRSATARLRTLLVEATLLAAIVVGALGFLPHQQALAQEFLPDDPPPTGRILRWIDNNPDGSVDHWQWRMVASPESPWSLIHGATQLEVNGLWYGISFPPPGILDVEIRAVGITGDTTAIVSEPSNSVTLPNCFDADLNRDGIVGGPDWGELAKQWSHTCVVTN